jgi:hypothetical protein
MVMWNHAKNLWLLCGLLTGLTLVLAVWWLPAVQARKDTVSQETRLRDSLRLQSEREPALADPTDLALLTFNQGLITQEALQAAASDLLRLVEAHGLILGPVDYQPEQVSNGFSSVQLVLPVKGKYLAIREFVVDALTHFPRAALDTMNLSRDSVETDEVTTILRFRFFLRQHAITPPKEQS